MYQYRNTQCPYCMHLFTASNAEITNTDTYMYRHKNTGIYLQKAKCPKCGKETSFSVPHDAIDESGEIYRCKHCKWLFQYSSVNK